MTSKLIKRNDSYFCSECRMKQVYELQPWCIFCGNIFSNYESIVIEQIKEKEENEMLQHELPKVL